MNWRRILSIIRKEWWHITRDKTSFGLLLLSPALALVTMAYAFSIDITDVGIEFEQEIDRLFFDPGQTTFKAPDSALGMGHSLAGPAGGS